MKLSEDPGSARVIFLDNHLLVVSKPAGQLVQGDRTGDRDLLTEAKEFVKRKYDKPGAVYLGLVHRLDRPASGVIVFARTSKAAGRLSGQFKNRTVSKRYVALVEGRLQGSGTCEGYIAKIHERPKIVEANVQGAKHARLAWRATACDRSTSLVDVDLHTGRPHQIRLQLSEMGHPIVGDLRYGAATEFDGKNLALHSYSLALDHPTRKNRMSFTDTPREWGESLVEALDSFLQ